MIIKTTLHENLVNILNGKETSGFLTPLESEFKYILENRNLWIWDTFNFNTDSIPDSGNGVDLNALRHMLSTYPDTLCVKMLKVMDDMEYTFNVYENESVNNVLQAFYTFVLEES